MGITYVVEWKAIEGKTEMDSLNSYCEKLESMGATRLPEKFVLEYDTFVPSNSNKTLIVVKSSDYPRSRFVQFEGMSNFITFDENINSFISRLGGVVQPKKGGKLSIRGYSFELNNYFIKIGVVSQANVSKSLSLEVEYRPCQFAMKQGWIFLMYLVRKILNTQQPSIPPLYQFAEPRPYTYEYTITQYLDLFNKVFNRGVVQKKPQQQLTNNMANNNQQMIRNQQIRPQQQQQQQQPMVTSSNQQQQQIPQQILQSTHHGNQVQQQGFPQQQQQMRLNRPITKQDG